MQQQKTQASQKVN